MGVRGDSQCTANFRTSADSRKVRLGCVERGCLCRLTLARDGCQWVASLGWRGIWRGDQSRGSGEAHQGSTEVSFRGGADTGTAVLLCHGKGGVEWRFSMQALVFKGLPRTQEVQWKAKPFRVADRI